MRRTHEFARVHAGNGRRRSRASASIGLACLCKRRRSRRRPAVGLLHPHNTTSCKEKMALIVCMRRRIGRSKEKKSLTERMHFGLIKFYYTGLACPLFTTHPFSNRSVLNGLVPTPQLKHDFYKRCPEDGQRIDSDVLCLCCSRLYPQPHHTRGARAQTLAGALYRYGGTETTLVSA